MDLAARNKETVLRNAYLKAKHQTERGAAGTPKAFVVPFHEQHDPLTTLKMIDKLLAQGNEEITSLIAKKLTETGQIPLSDPQIWFTGGRIYMTGGIKPFGPFQFHSIIVATAVVDQGQLVFKVQEAQMGAFDFPDAILESITQTVNEALVSILIDLDITRLEILEGEMFVLGIRAV